MPNFAPSMLVVSRGGTLASDSDPNSFETGSVNAQASLGVNYTFRPGHRIMVQIQSSLFPLYDRNPQTYVPNIFFAKPEDYQPATVSVVRGPEAGSAVLLPVVATSGASE